MKLACGANDPYYFRRGLRHILYKYYGESTPDDILDEIISFVSKYEEDFKNDECYKKKAGGGE